MPNQLTAAFIPVRLSSTRLPSKATRVIRGKSCIQHLVERVKRSELLDTIILCTTTNPTDDALESIAKGLGIQFFRGSEKDILDRYLQASKAFEVANIINVDGDDIFCEPSLIDLTVRELKTTDTDCILWRNLPLGAAPIGIRTSALEKICSLKETGDTETGWTKFFTESGLFHVKYLLPSDPELVDANIRLTLDYEEDLELFKQIYNNLDEPFDLKDIVRLLHRHPELQKINDSVKEQYMKNFENKSAQVKLKSASP